MQQCETEINAEMLLRLLRDLKEGSWLLFTTMKNAKAPNTLCKMMYQNWQNFQELDNILTK